MPYTLFDVCPHPGIFHPFPEREGGIRGMGEQNPLLILNGVCGCSASKIAACP